MDPLQNSQGIRDGVFAGENAFGKKTGVKPPRLGKGGESLVQI